MSRVLLDGVTLRPHRVTLGGALGSLLAAAGRELPQHYVMGVSGLAFRLTLDAVFSPGSQAEVNFHQLFPLWERLGVWMRRSGEREESLAHVKASLERGWPAIAYDLLGLQEYGLVVGAEEGRLACLTLANPDEVRWMEAADWPPAGRGDLARPEAITLLDVATEFDRQRAEAASIRFAVERFWAPPSRDLWVHHGIKAYEFWVAVLSSSMPLHGPEAGLGHSYNLLCLHRARRDAAAYLAELAERNPALAPGAAAFRQVEAELAQALELAPFPGERLVQDGELRRTLAARLRQVMETERRGIDALERALRTLG